MIRSAPHMKLTIRDFYKVIQLWLCMTAQDALSVQPYRKAHDPMSEC